MLLNFAVVATVVQLVIVVGKQFILLRIAEAEHRQLILGTLYGLGVIVLIGLIGYWLLNTLSATAIL
jgi:hypothetical protein